MGGTLSLLLFPTKSRCVMYSSIWGGFIVYYMKIKIGLHKINTSVNLLVNLKTKT